MKSNITWIPVNEALQFLDVGRERLSQLRRSGTIAAKKNKKGVVTHVSLTDVVSYRDKVLASPRLSRSREVGLAMRGTTRKKSVAKKKSVIKPIIKTEAASELSLVKFGDVYALPKNASVYAMGSNGMTKLDTSKLIVM